MRQLWDAMKQISGANKKKILFALAILLLIWLILPRLPIDDTHPFASLNVRIVLTVLLVLGIAAWSAVGFFQKHRAQTLQVLHDKSSHIWQITKEVAHTIWLYSKEYYNDLHDRIKTQHKRRRLKRMPWYLMLGGQQAGKRSFIQNTGLYFQRPDYLGEEALNYIKQFPDYDWWFTQQGIFIDPQISDEESSLKSWKKFIKLLKRERRHKPLNGIILTISLPDLIILSHKSRQEFAQRIGNLIRDIHYVFNSFVPVYLVLNKADLVAGFMEFFENLSKEELSQVWGMTLPIDQCNDLQQVLGFFNREYAALLEQLRKRVMWSLDTERTMRGRELIHAFPQQLQLLKKPLETFIAELFGASRYQKALQFRGVYLTSCTQNQAEPYDFLLQAMSKKFQLVPPKFRRGSRVGECYFVRSLLQAVILPEATLLGDSERRKKIRRFVYRTLLLSCPVAVIATGFGMHIGYQENIRNLQAINVHVQDYQRDLQAANNSADVFDISPAMQQLQRAKALYTQSNQWGLNFLLSSHFIKSDLIDAEQRALHAYFLPRIAAEIEQTLNDNLKDPNLMYAYLKGYLAFSAADYTNQHVLREPMEYRWDQDFANHPEVAENLKALLNTALQTDIDKLPLDHKLIDRTRNQLETIIPEQRAYGLLSLRASVSDHPDIFLSSAGGSQFDAVFFEKDSGYRIPALYTDTVYEDVYLPDYQHIANEVANDNHDIGLSSASAAQETAGALEDNLQTTYNDHYSKAWQQALDNVQVKSFSSLDEAVSTLNVLISKDSPMPKLLNVVYDNTHAVDHGKVNVDSHFEDINDYSQHKGWGASWQDSVKILTQVRDYLVKLQQAPNQNQASLDAAKAIIQGGSDNPMQALAAQATRAPQPIQRWLQQLSNQCWQIIVKSAYQQIDSAWQQTIMTSYNTGMRDRFPFNVNSDSSVDIDDFNHIFGSGAALDTFFDQYIKPFVNSSNNTWRLYNVHGLSMEFPSSLIAMFAQAKIIQSEFFPNGATTAKLAINIKPLTLTARAASAELVAGSQQVLYSHGPQNVSTVTWPFADGADTSRVVITDFKSNQYSRWANGSWSLFKLLQQGSLQTVGDDGSYHFVVDLKGYTATYELTGPSDMNIFTLKYLKGFSMPEHIAMPGSSGAAAGGQP